MEADVCKVNASQTLSIFGKKSRTSNPRKIVDDDKDGSWLEAELQEPGSSSSARDGAAVTDLVPVKTNSCVGDDNSADKKPKRKKAITKKPSVWEVTFATKEEKKKKWCV
jgi:hypothetical protein